MVEIILKANVYLGIYLEQWVNLGYLAGVFCWEIYKLRDELREMSGWSTVTSALSRQLIAEDEVGDGTHSRL